MSRPPTLGERFARTVLGLFLLGGSLLLLERLTFPRRPGATPGARAHVGHSSPLGG